VKNPVPSAVDAARDRFHVYPESIRGEGRLFTESAGLHLALGMFDGVHRGHQVVVGAALRESTGRNDHLSGVLTFDPHPSRILYPEKATALIYPLEQRLECLLSLGIDFVLTQPFDRDFASRSAEDFLPWLHEVLPGLQSLHVGENFRFGAGRRGTAETLKEEAAAIGIQVHVHARDEDEGEAISSSRIRENLREGAIEAVNRMLGRPYTARGPVVSGQGLGRNLGFPTLNIRWQPEVAPRYGVYEVALASDHDDSTFSGIANFGVRPTVSDDREPVLEVHLLEPAPVSSFLKVRVEFLNFIRPEQSFANAEALKKQIAADVEAVRGRS